MVEFKHKYFTSKIIKTLSPSLPRHTLDNLLNNQINDTQVTKE